MPGCHGPSSPSGRPAWRGRGKNTLIPSVYPRHAISVSYLSEEILRMEQVSKKRTGLVLVAVVALAALLQGGTASAQEMKPFLTLKTAKTMAEAAEKKATA